MVPRVEQRDGVDFGRVGSSRHGFPLREAGWAETGEVIKDGGAVAGVVCVAGRGEGGVRAHGAGEREIALAVIEARAPEAHRGIVGGQPGHDAGPEGGDLGGGQDFGRRVHEFAGVALLRGDGVELDR